jgi:hypothetical protein
MPVIPRTAPRRGERTYALLVLRQSPRLKIFEGVLLKTGRAVEESALRPTPHYPEIPLLIEFAGNDGSGRGHNRSRDIHILWRYAGGEWEEIARSLSQGSEWFDHLAPIVRRELVRPTGVDHVGEARAAAGRLAALIDGELSQLAEEGRERALAFLYDQVAARFAESVTAAAVVLGPGASLAQPGAPLNSGSAAPPARPRFGPGAVRVPVWLRQAS